MSHFLYNDFSELEDVILTSPIVLLVKSTNEVKYYNPDYQFKLDEDGNVIDVTPTVYYTITTTANPTSGGSVSPVSTSAKKNSTVTLTATANTGYKFSKWEDDNTENPRTINVTASATYTADFVENAEDYTTNMIANWDAISSEFTEGTVYPSTGVSSLTCKMWKDTISGNILDDSLGDESLSTASQSHANTTTKGDKWLTITAKSKLCDSYNGSLITSTSSAVLANNPLANIGTGNFTMLIAVNIPSVEYDNSILKVDNTILGKGEGRILINNSTNSSTSVIATTVCYTTTSWIDGTKDTLAIIGDLVLTLVRNGNTMSVYRNGQVIATNDCTDFSMLPDSLLAVYGLSSTTLSTNVYAVRLWNTALTATQVALTEAYLADRFDIVLE